MINILALVPDQRAPSCRFRIRQFIEPLRSEGIRLEVREVARKPAARRRLFREASFFAAVILHRKLLRRPDYLTLRSCARRLIYDLDDAVMFRDSNARRLHSPSRLRKFRRLAGGADLVLAGNDYLRELAAGAGAAVETFATVVDTAVFTGSQPPGDGKTIGWMGTSSNFVYLTAVLPALRALLESDGGLVFKVVADRPPLLEGIPVVYRKWSEAEEAAQLAGFTVGIMPLADDPWARGKCAFKVLQYGAASVPAVCSPVGANLSAVQDGVTGYFARDERQWRDRLAELLAAPEKREKMGRAARQLVEENYSLAGAVPRLARIIRGII